MARYFLIAAALLGWLLWPCSAEAANFDARSAKMAQVSGLKINSEDDKARIVLNTGRAVKYKQTVLSSPDRIVVDIKNAWIDTVDKKDQKVAGKFVSRVRLAQFDDSTVRVVIHTKPGQKNFKIFTLDNPARLVIDVGKTQSDGDSSGLNIDLWDAKKEAPPTSKPKKTDENPKKKPVPSDSDDDDSNPNFGSFGNDEEIKDDEEEEEKPKRRFFDFGKRKDKEDESNFSETDKAIAEITGLKGRVIVIDPGHGGSDPGAIGPTGVTEKSVTLKVALALREILQEEGATVHMTRTKDTEVSPKGKRATDIEELQARCDVANKLKADVFISIHMDSFTNEEANGTTGYYYSKGSSKSRALADKVRAGLIEQIHTNSRGTKPCDFYVVRKTDMPATLVEVAFISNRAEEKLLNSTDGAKRAAQGIADGIADYFG